MASYLISYDLSTDRGSPHTEFLKQAETEGLLYVWTGVNFVSRLPNTTLWGEFPSRAEAEAAFGRARAKTEVSVGYKVVVEKRVTTPSKGCAVVSDHKKKPDRKWTGATPFETSRLHQNNDPFF